MRQKRALTTGEVAHYCGVNFRTVIRWIERGRVKAYRLPDRGDYRIAVCDFVDFLQVNAMPIPEEWVERSRRVLIVEDDLPMANAIRRVLRHGGFETMIAPDGFRAGTLLGIFAPAVMTLDLRMPGLPGLEVVRFVRSTKGLKAVKILVVSALPRKDLNEALTAGADDVLEKPFRNGDLIEKISTLAGIRAGAQRPG